jgi:hypothetical protein
LNEDICLLPDMGSRVVNNQLPGSARLHHCH